MVIGKLSLQEARWGKSKEKKGNNILDTQGLG